MTFHVVAGGQFGSEGKGAFCKALIARYPIRAAVRVAGPNAGHTVYDAQGTRFALRSVPVAAVLDPSIALIIGPGSEIDLQVLFDEIALIEAAGYPMRDRLLIDAQATILEPAHREQEGGNDGPLQQRLGSTGKGVGAARADRVMRTARTAGQAHELFDAGQLVHPDTGSVLLSDDADGDILIEGTQGFGLGLHAGYYPFCTSSDCRAVDFLAMAGLPHDVECIPWVVSRTYPIRVAGNSGPLLDETSWEDLAKLSGGHIQPEYTTVTRKLRRIGRWDQQLFARAMRANGRHARAVLMFADYVDPTIAGRERPSALLSDWIADEMLTLWRRRHEPWFVGTGPDHGYWAA